MTDRLPFHRRRAIRLSGRDYSAAGAYFVTVCTLNREPAFGTIVDGDVHLNAIGHVVADTWRWLTVQYSYVSLDEWCVMPDHLHGILVIGGSRAEVGGSRTEVGGSRAEMGGSRTAPTGDTVTTGVDADVVGPRTGAGGSRTEVAGSRAEMGGSRTAPTGDTVTTDIDAAFTRRKPIGELIGAFKTVSTKQINALRNTPGAPVWQRDFWDHVVRNEADLQRIREYIRDNVHL